MSKINRNPSLEKGAQDRKRQFTEEMQNDQCIFTKSLLTKK